MLAAYEQIAGQTFNVDCNTRASYAEQDSVNGTDATGETFVLHNTTGAVVDANIQLLIHADGVNGSTDIIDERGITPFGTSCAYFDGAAYWEVPSSNKIAWGTSQDWTVECRFRAASLTNSPKLHGCRVAGAETVSGGVVSISSGGVLTFSSKSTTRITGSGTILVDTWDHFARRRTSGMTTMYINGSSVGSFSDILAYAAAAVSYRCVLEWDE